MIDECHESKEGGRDGERQRERLCITALPTYTTANQCNQRYRSVT